MRTSRLLVFTITLFCAVTLVPLLSGQETGSDQRLTPEMPEQLADSLWWEAPPDTGAVIRSAMRHFQQKPLSEFSLQDHPLTIDEVDTVVSQVQYMGRYWIAYLVAYLSHEPDDYSRLALIGGMRAFESWLQRQECLSEARIVELVRRSDDIYALAAGVPPVVHIEFRLRLQERQDSTRVVSIEIPDDYRPLF